jgi:Putative prokaryotic signal transducing protein
VKAVLFAQTPADAHLAASILEEHGIETWVGNEMLSQARGELPLDESTMPTVFVLDDARAEEAEALLRESGRRRAGPDWTCASCREPNGDAFEVCWNCGTERPAPSTT